MTFALLCTLAFLAYEVLAHVDDRLTEADLQWRYPMPRAYRSTP